MSDGSNRHALSTRYDAIAIRNQIDYKREFNNTNSLRVTVPNLPFDSFDAAGEKVNPRSLMHLIDSGQFTSFMPLNPDSSSNEDLIRTYLVYHELEIDQSLYNPNNPKFPLLMEFKFRYAKNTSRSGTCVLRHPTRTVPYAKTEHVSVRVDPFNRKPLPFPEWWKAKYGIPSEGHRTEHVKPEKYPTVEIFENEQRVNYGHVDSNGHANYSFYTLAAMNSFAENLFNGKLQKDAAFYFQNGIKKIQSTYYKECLMGDGVNVLSWVNEHSSDIYYFEFRNNGELCARQTWRFHEHPLPSVDSKL